MKDSSNIWAVPAVNVGLILRATRRQHKKAFKTHLMRLIFAHYWRACIVVVVVVSAAFPSWTALLGSPSICTSTLTNAFRRVRALCHRYKKKIIFFNELLIITPPHEQPHAVLGGFRFIWSTWFISISGGWMLLHKELMAEESAHITMQRMTTL